MKISEKQLSRWKSHKSNFLFENVLHKSGIWEKPLSHLEKFWREVRATLKHHILSFSLPHMISKNQSWASYIALILVRKYVAQLLNT